MSIWYVSLMFLCSFCVPTSDERQEWVSDHRASWCVSVVQDKGISVTQPGSHSRGLAWIFHISPSYLLVSAQTVLITHWCWVGAEQWVCVWGRSATVMAGGNCRMGWAGLPVVCSLCCGHIYLVQLSPHHHQAWLRCVEPFRWLNLCNVLEDHGWWMEDVSLTHQLK